MRKILFSIIVFLISGCLSYSEIDHQKCLGFGFTPGTQGYTDCRVNLDARRAREALEAEKMHTQERLERERMQTQERLEREKTNRLHGVIDGLFNNRRHDVCMEDWLGHVHCGNECMKDTFGHVHCGHMCMKDTFGHVHCGNECMKDTFGHVHCGNVCMRGSFGGGVTCR